MPTVVGINRQSFDCPGLEWRERSGGKRVPVWKAPKRAVRVGYTPKSVPLSPELSEVEIAAVCRRLQAEVFEFMAVGSQVAAPRFDGTIGSLCEIYQTHELSPFKLAGKLKWNTQVTYSADLKKIIEIIGGRQLHAITAVDVWAWYQDFRKPSAPGEKERITQAQRFMRMIRTVLKFGIMVEVSPHCSRLAASKDGVITQMRFETPQPRTAFVNADMVAILRDYARRHDYGSVALAIAIQFETALRQRDVIGEWAPDPEAGKNPEGRGPLWKRNFVWQAGLLWGAHVDPKSLIMIKPTSKSGFKKTAISDWNLCPMILEELHRVPFDRRIGPVVVQEAGRAAGQPWERIYFSNVCKNLIRELAITDDRFIGITNMDMRSGALTEALDELDGDSIEFENVQKLLGTHSQKSQTQTYNRMTLNKVQAMQTRRITGRARGGDSGD